MEKKKINSKKKVMIVAEIGNNHEGSFRQAKKLIQKAAQSGVDAVKFQTFKTEEFINDKDQKKYKRYKKFELTKEESVKHDEIFYYEALATLEDKELGYGGSKLWNKVRKNLDWFRKNNAKAYMVLLD